MASHVRALLFCICLCIAPVLCWAGRTVAGVWGEIGLPVVVVGASAAYAAAAAPPEEQRRVDESVEPDRRRSASRRKSA